MWELGICFSEIYYICVKRRRKKKNHHKTQNACSWNSTFQKRKKLKQASELWNPKIMRVLHFLRAKKQSRGQEFFLLLIKLWTYLRVDNKIINLPGSCLSEKTCLPLAESQMLMWKIRMATKYTFWIISSMSWLDVTSTY